MATSLKSRERSLFLQIRARGLKPCETCVARMFWQDRGGHAVKRALGPVYRPQVFESSRGSYAFHRHARASFESRGGGAIRGRAGLRRDCVQRGSLGEPGADIQRLFTTLRARVDGQHVLECDRARLNVGSSASSTGQHRLERIERTTQHMCSSASSTTQHVLERTEHDST